jgi:DNA-binding CsgD family transcriptional regulator
MGSPPKTQEGPACDGVAARLEGFVPTPGARRQDQVLHGLLKGLSDKQIAATLGLSRHTVHVYVKHIHRRYRVSSRAELLSLWIPVAAISVLLGSVPEAPSETPGPVLCRMLRQLVRGRPIARPDPHRWTRDESDPSPFRGGDPVVTALFRPPPKFGPPTKRAAERGFRSPTSRGGGCRERVTRRVGSLSRRQCATRIDSTTGRTGTTRTPANASILSHTAARKKPPLEPAPNGTVPVGIPFAEAGAETGWRSATRPPPTACRWRGPSGRRASRAGPPSLGLALCTSPRRQANRNTSASSPSSDGMSVSRHSKRTSAVTTTFW